MAEYTNLNMACAAAGYSASGAGLVCRIKGHPGDLSATYHAESETVTCNIPDSIDKSATCEVYSLKDPLLPPCCTSSIGQDEIEGNPAGQVVLSLADDGDGEEVKDKKTTSFSGLKPFIIISVSYLLYTITDGAIRMIVLLQAYNLGFSAWDVALMFTAYELAGVFTNLAAGMLGAKWGIKNTLLTGLCLQIVGISMLYAWQDSWSEPGQKWKAILFVTFAQMLCGIAKDLTKLGGKTVTKLVTPDEKQSQLFRLVALLTGWKNSLKGVGYFIGAAAVSFSFQFALGLLLFLILLALPWAITGLSNQLGRAKSKNLGLSQIFKQVYNINVLSFSRFFLFGSRDVWFEVPLPFFLRNSIEGLGWSRVITGMFLALFIIVYGQVQAYTPQLITKPLRQEPENSLTATFWCFVLLICPLFLGIMMQSSPYFVNHDVEAMTGILVSGLGAFCVIFAINSSVHSYLIVKYADGDKVAMNVGFYYMANAMGRFAGTLASGALYSFLDPNSVLVGFTACFWVSTALVFASGVVDLFIRDGQGGLKFGPITIVKPAFTANEPPDEEQLKDQEVKANKTEKDAV